MRGFFFLAIIASSSTWATTGLLIKFRNGAVPSGFIQRYGGALTPISAESRAYRWQSEIGGKPFEFSDDASVEYVQLNHPIRLLVNPSLQRNEIALRSLFRDADFSDGPAYPDNPSILSPTSSQTGDDAMLSQSWGLFQVGAPYAWQKTPQGKGVVVAITDTGVDYNHEDLINNMWRNPGEIAGDKLDNDQNGFVDDIVGWDFFSNDSLPYDLSMSLGDILFKGGNPGHGTHVAGVVAAQLRNVRGTAGIAPKSTIMALRFISEEGKGDSAGAIGAIDYAVRNGARIINASWGSEGEEEGDELLRESIQRAEARGVLFVAAAGNGRADPQTMQSAGYDNDNDAKPMFPATYPYSNIVAVAAMTNLDGLAQFSNFGKKSVDIGAPGVKILSTIPGNRYQDTIIDVGQIKVTWDGTSMAAPFIAGALATIASLHPTYSQDLLIGKLLDAAKPSANLNGKVVTDGRLDLSTL